MGFPGGASSKRSACQCRRCERYRFDPWVRKIPWRRTWQPTPVFLPGKSHEQRGLAGYSPWRCRVRYDCACMQYKVHNKSNFNGKEPFLFGFRTHGKTLLLQLSLLTLSGPGTCQCLEARARGGSLWPGLLLWLILRGQTPS